jgi:hypothetical protein
MSSGGPTLQSDHQYEQFVNKLDQNLATVQQACGSRALGSAVTGGTPSAPAGQDAQRFLGAILSGLVQHVVPAAAQGILGLLQQRRRELGLPEQRDVERDFESILTVLLPKLIDAVPSIVSAITGESAPRSTEEEAERFLPFLAAVVPAVISAVPSIINAINRQRGVAAPPPPITDPDVAQRFIGPLVASLVPQLLQSAPSILGSIFGNRRDTVTRTGGLRVTVQGDLTREVMDQINRAVQDAVRDEVATIDLLRDYREDTNRGLFSTDLFAGGLVTGGIVYRPPGGFP